MRLRRLVVCLGCLGCLGCGGVEMLEPAGATAVDLGARFAAAWQATEQCSGLAGEPAGVPVFSVPGDHILLDGRPVVAYWASTTNSIYIASFYLPSDPVLRHEILHSLLRTGGHPREYFVTRCGSVVGTG